MKAENMKLPDLQTGKYLELGKDWLYGGEYIVTMSCIEDKYYNECCFLTDSGWHYEDSDFAGARLYKSEPQGTLKTLCDKTGGVVYGLRYVLLTEKSGIFCENNMYILYLKGKRIESLTTETMNFNKKYQKLPTDDILPFEEYSKQLRKEENKFDELMEQLK
jgi:hypothetical protein